MAAGDPDRFGQLWPVLPSDLRVGGNQTAYRDLAQLRLQALAIVEGREKKADAGTARAEAERLVLWALGDGSSRSVVTDVF